MGSGSWLKNARRRAEFPSQAALATAVGVSRGAVGNWESDRGVPTMANAERLAVVLRRPRSEVLAKFGYPIGGGDPAAAELAEVPPGFFTSIQQAIAAGVADGVVQVLDQLRREGLLPAADATDGRSQRRRSA